jgi:glycosyltransferase involved in cell wall biosynthesis
VELRTKMGAAARARVEDNYSMDSMARRTLELYRAALEKKCEARGSNK